MINCDIKKGFINTSGYYRIYNFDIKPIKSLPKSRVFSRNSETKRLIKN